MVELEQINHFFDLDRNSENIDPSGIVRLLPLVISKLYFGDFSILSTCCILDLSLATQLNHQFKRFIRNKPAFDNKNNSMINLSYTHFAVT